MGKSTTRSRTQLRQKTRTYPDQALRLNGRKRRNVNGRRKRRRLRKRGLRNGQQAVEAARRDPGPRKRPSFRASRRKPCPHTCSGCRPTERKFRSLTPVPESPKSLKSPEASGKRWRTRRSGTKRQRQTRRGTTGRGKNGWRREGKNCLRRRRSRELMTNSFTNLMGTECHKIICL